MSKITIEFNLFADVAEHIPRWATIIFLQENAKPIAYFIFDYNLETFEHIIDCTVYAHGDPNRWNQHTISKIGEQHNCSRFQRNWTISIGLSEFSGLFRLLKQAANVT